MLYPEYINMLYLQLYEINIFLPLRRKYHKNCKIYNLTGTPPPIKLKIKLKIKVIIGMNNFCIINQYVIVFVIL